MPFPRVLAWSLCSQIASAPLAGSKPESMGLVTPTHKSVYATKTKAPSICYGIEFNEGRKEWYVENYGMRKSTGIFFFFKWLLTALNKTVKYMIGLSVPDR